MNNHSEFAEILLIISKAIKRFFETDLEQVLIFGDVTIIIQKNNESIQS